MAIRTAPKAKPAVKQALPVEAEKERRNKVPVTIRLDADIVERFKATGRGWQSRMNDALRSASL